MNQEQAEGLAEKIIQDALENIRRLGFHVMVRERIHPHSSPMFTPVEAKNAVVISDERFKRGDY